MPVFGRVGHPRAGTRTALGLVLAAAALVIPATAAAAPVGSDAVHSRRDSNGAGSAEAFKAVASATASVTRLHVYLDATSTADRIEIGLYGGSSKPGDKLGSCGVSSPAAGWNDCALPSSVTVTKGKTYWTALLAPRSADGVIRFRDLSSTGTVSYGSSSSSLSSLPSSFRTGDKWPSAPASMYADSAIGETAQGAIPLPPVDSDGDGVPDLLDKCPTQAGPAPSGCPATPPPPPDGDGDGVPDSSDQCPTQAGPSSNHGCPVPPADSDGDGVPDSSDQCPTQAGPSSNHGCPVPPPDGDGDGVPDSSDQCPTQAGPSSNHGCPVSPPPSNGKNCMPTPSSCGFPDMTNTGTLPGVARTAVSGTVTLSTPGQVYENKTVTGGITVTAANVTIRNVKVIARVGWAVRCRTQDGGCTGLKVTDTEIDMDGSQNGWGNYGLLANSYTATRVQIHDGADCAYAERDVTIRDSLCSLGPDADNDGWADNTSFCSGPEHFDGFSSDGGARQVYDHNTIRNPCSQTSAILMSTNSSAINDVTITNNLLAGGGYTLYCAATSGGVGGNETVTGNRIAKTYRPQGGYYGPVAYCSTADTFNNNVWDDTGATINP